MIIAKITAEAADAVGRWLEQKFKEGDPVPKEWMEVAEALIALGNDTDAIVTDDIDLINRDRR